MNHLESGFRLLAISCAMTYGFNFTPNCQNRINWLIREGIKDLYDPASSDEIEEAQKNLIRFISEMVNDAKNNPRKELQELNFDFAFNLLCPIPPWRKAPC